jgi:hypothetical protein
MGENIKNIEKEREHEKKFNLFYFFFVTNEYAIKRQILRTCFCNSKASSDE